MEIERAWEGFKPPPLKPGDTVHMLRPSSINRFPFPLLLRLLLTAVDQRSRICIVNRFWRERGGEKQAFVFLFQNVQIYLQKRTKALQMMQSGPIAQQFLSKTPKEFL